MPHYDYAAVAPLAPALPAAGEGLAALFPLIAWGICLSLLYVWRRTVGAMIEHLANLLDRAAVHAFGRTIHFLGPVSAGLRDVDGAIQRALDVAAKATERATVYLFHKSVATFELVGRELYHIAEDAGRAFLAFELHTIPRLVKRGVHALEHRVEQIVHAATRLEHAIVRPLERLVHRLEATVERDFGIARRGIDVTKRDLARAEREIKRDAARLSKVEAALGIAAFAALMLRGLDRLGLKWLRCPSLLRMGSRIGCVGFGFLEGLLFLAWETFAVLDLCRFAAGMTKLAEEMRPLFMDFVDVEEALVGCRGATKPPNLSVPKLTLPPTNAGLKLAA